MCCLKGAGCLSPILIIISIKEYLHNIAISRYYFDLQLPFKSFCFQNHPKTYLKQKWAHLVVLETIKYSFLWSTWLHAQSNLRLLGNINPNISRVIKSEQRVQRIAQLQQSTKISKNTSRIAHIKRDTLKGISCRISKMSMSSRRPLS